MQRNKQLRTAHCAEIDACLKEQQEGAKGLAIDRRQDRSLFLLCFKQARYRKAS
jgi:hypothetical protein